MTMIYPIQYLIFSSCKVESNREDVVNVDNWQVFLRVFCCGGVNICHLFRSVTQQNSQNGGFTKSSVLIFQVIFFKPFSVIFCVFTQSNRYTYPQNNLHRHVTFPVFAGIPVLEVSPGTCFLIFVGKCEDKKND